MKNLKLIIIVLTTLIISFICPFILEHLIYRNNYYSVLSNGEWSGFLGSYISGLIGGIGTLVAVFISINETRKVQYKSDKDKDYIERKVFSDEIIVYISKYITDINKYFYNCKSAKRNKEHLQQKKKDLKELQDKINQCNEKLPQIYSNTEEVIKLSLEKEDLEKKESILKDIIFDIEREIELYRADRTIAIECYYILNIKLKDISIASPVISQLEYIHNHLFDQNNEWISIETKKLIALTVSFINNYCNEAYQ